MKEPTTSEILKELTEIAETYKICIKNIQGEDEDRITKVFWNDLTLKLSFYNVMFNIIKGEKK